ncbi:hypothetical protein Pth03_43140 [Planotetraspora thailandica]|uniref:Uncharacterized protein n=1 Tax=Planotetraspora thailandica TaxID=487172 RepID=A0A8J3XXB7_9ACTN|nr:hypothetical protein Pth03_43140 [Planotetraspora thailandica]
MDYVASTDDDPRRQEMSWVTWRDPLQPVARGSLRRLRDGDPAAPRPYPAWDRSGVSWS